MVVEKILELFEALENNWPTQERTHSITYGKESGGIMLSVYHSGGWNTFHAEGNDLDDIPKAIEEIKAWLK